MVMICMLSYIIFFYWHIPYSGDIVNGRVHLVYGKGQAGYLFVFQFLNPFH